MKLTQYSIEEMKKYTGLDNKVLEIVKKIEVENQYKYPLDILCYLTSLISYDDFIFNLKKEPGYDRVLNGHIKQFFDENLFSAEKLSGSIKNSIMDANMVPLTIRNGVFFFGTIIENYKQYTEAKESLFMMTTLKSKFSPESNINIIPMSNLSFLDVYNKVLGFQKLDVSQIEITQTQRLDLLFLQAIINKASDIYFDETRKGLNVNISVYGDTVPLTTLNMNSLEINGLLKQLALMGGEDMDRVKTDTPLFDFKVGDLANQNNKFYGRVNMVKDSVGLRTVMRIGETDKVAIPYDKLALSANIKNDLMDGLLTNNGLFLVAGETGSGKTTTLTSIVNRKRELQPTLRIEEFSKPVEATIEGISQIDVDEKSNLTMEVLMEAATRRNAQVIYMGELNSPKLLHQAINASLMGKKIFSTIHTSSVEESLDRVRLMVLEQPYMYYAFIDNLTLILHQSMVKKICPVCKREIKVSDLSEHEQKILSAFKYSKSTVYKTNPNSSCRHCEDRGYMIKEPVIIASSLLFTEDLKEKLRETTVGVKRILEDFMYEKQRMEIFDALKYVAEGVVGLDTVYYKLNMPMVRKSLLEGPSANEGSNFSY